MAPCTHPGTSREVNEVRWPHTCSRPCAFQAKKIERKNPEKYAPPETHHEIHSRPATASNSKQHERKHVRRVSLYSLASKDPRVKNRLRRFAPSALPYTRQEVKEARDGLIREAGRVRSKEKQIKKKKTEKSAPPETHHEIRSRPATSSRSKQHSTKTSPTH